MFLRNITFLINGFIDCETVDVISVELEAMSLDSKTFVADRVGQSPKRVGDSSK